MWTQTGRFYLIYALTKGDKVSKPFLVQSYWFAGIFVTLLAVLHVPHDVEQEKNFTGATTIREGAEWFMGPVLQNQNFHLIHHLFPMTPFYNNHKVWRLLEPELRKKDLSIQHNFSIQPTRYPAAQSAARP